MELFEYFIIIGSVFSICLVFYFFVTNKISEFIEKFKDMLETFDKVLSSLKAGQTKLEADIAKLEAGQTKLEAKIVNLKSEHTENQNRFKKELITEMANSMLRILDKNKNKKNKDS